MFKKGLKEPPPNIYDGTSRVRVAKNAPKLKKLQWFFRLNQ